MKNKRLIAEKIARAKRIVARCNLIAPPLWAVVWASRG